MQHSKPLHVASCFEDLNQFANRTNTNIKRIPRIKEVAKKLYQESKREPLDEEVTYIYLYRFLKIYDYLLNSTDDKKYIEIVFGKEAGLATAQLNSITSSLKRRYDELCKEKHKKNAVTAKPNVTGPAEVVPVSKQLKPEKQPVFNKGIFISCTDLYRVLQNSTYNILIMDIRKPADFKESHIKDVKCINIPEDLIRSGLSTNTLGQTLPKESLEQWEKRDSFDVIVLMDWSTSSNNYIASRLDKLRTILLEWDIDSNYTEDPVILDNGYSDWLEMYPTLCSGSNLKYTKANLDLDELLDLDLIEYPYESHAYKKPKLAKYSDSRGTVPDQVHVDIQKGPTITEITETATTDILKQEEDLINLKNKIANEYDLSVLEKLNREEKELTDTISKLRRKDDLILKVVTEVPEEIFEDKPKPISTAPDKENTEFRDEQNRQRLLDEARKAKKPEYLETKIIAKPTIDRATKPKVSESIRHPTQRKEDPLKYGLTGLVNIKNTCYMNSVIQCLRHIPQIVDYFCDGDFLQKITCKHPAIMKEMGNLIRGLWSCKNHSVIRPTEFYNKMIILYPLYKQGHHEDCMEFFIQLLTFLNEDCAFEITSKPHWSESELAWYSQHSGKTSFFIENFYHQIKGSHTCAQCSRRKLKYEMENVFYVNVPNYKFQLKDCMASYMTTSDQFVCKQCKQPYRVNKSICHYPKILVIVLKRHLQTNVLNNVPIFKKNDKQCNFPIEYLIGSTLYVLKGISLHSGTMEAGHYTAACHNDLHNRWYLFNDESVDPVDIESEQIGINAYAFFYSKVENDS